MIKTLQQAIKVQLSRVVSCKPGHAHAVRRFLQRDLDLRSTIESYNCYMARKALLPHLGKFPAHGLTKNELIKLAEFHKLN